VRLRRVRALAAGLIGSPWVRLAGSLIAVAIFVRSVDLGQAVRLYAQLVPGWAALAVVLAAASVVASVAEWGVLLRGSGHHLDWSFLGSWYLKGLFVNQVTPAGVGSDAMRALQVGKTTGHGPMVASLVASRMAGTLAMSWWALAAAVIARDQLNIPGVSAFVLFAAAMMGAWVAALVAEVVRRRIPEHRIIAHAMGRFVRPFTSAFNVYRCSPVRTVGRSIAAGVVAWGLNLFSMASFAMALHSHTSWSVFALTLPVALLATFIPISANGIGVREGLIVLLLVRAHVALGTATALSLFVDLQLLPFAVLGGAVYLMERRRRNVTTTQQSRSRPMNPEDFPAPASGFVITHFLVVSDQDRSREYYRSIFDATVVLERDPVILKVANTWLILNVGGGPTDDKPTVTLTTPPDADRTSAFLNVRVADIHKAYADWSAKGANFLTEPKDHEREIRAYIRDPDGHLIEVGQSTP
jgi:lactoylglutathione lyase